MNDNPYSAPAATDIPVAEAPVTVQISAKTVRSVNSPLFLVVSTLTGVSITFVSLGMLGLGIWNQWNVLTVGAALTCWLIGYLVPMFYFRIAGEVIKQVYKK